MVNDMRIGSLFSGIGGLDLGLEWAGVGRTVWQVERDPFCRSILARHWPDAVRFDDVRTVGSHNLEPVDVICGGFPCQDISYAGKGLGLSGERSGLWYEFARIVGEMGPRFVVVENVAALIARGIGDVLGTLSDLGYDAQWRAVRASDVGAPHRRERIFIVAYTKIFLGKRTVASGDRRWKPKTAPGNGSCAMAHADEHRSQGERIGRILDGERAALWHDVDGRDGSKRRGQTQPRLGGAAHGISERLDRWPSRPGEPQADWEAPRTVEKADNRAARLRALGNAVVPQVGAEIGKWLLQINASID